VFVVTGPFGGFADGFAARIGDEGADERPRDLLADVPTPAGATPRVLTDPTAPELLYASMIAPPAKHVPVAAPADAHHSATFMLRRYTHVLDGKHALTLDLDPEPHGP
jgi:hypothetical protein